MVRQPWRVSAPVVHFSHNSNWHLRINVEGPRQATLYIMYKRLSICVYIYIHNLVYIIYITISIVYSYIYMNGSSCCFEGGWLFYLWGDCTELPISSGSFSSLPVAIGQVSTWLKWQVSKFTNRTVRSRERTAASTSGTVDWSMSQDRRGVPTSTGRGY